MNRVFRIAALVLLAFVLFIPAVRAAGPSAPNTGRVLISTGGDITLPAGQHADAVVVIHGTATILGEANVVVVIDGAANLVGARTESVMAVQSTVSLGTGTVVQHDVMTISSTVTRAADAQVGGTVRDVTIDAAGIGLLLAPAIILLYLGFGLAAIGAGLLLAALASKQVRSAERLISQRPIATLATGLAGVILPMFVVVILMVSVIGAPLGLGILFGLWPLTAFIGYLVAGIWIGDWILRRTSPAVERQRPYLAAVIGIIALAVLGIVPFLAAIADLFGFGAVILLAWQTIRPSTTAAPIFQGQAPAPMTR